MTTLTADLVMQRSEFRTMSIEEKLEAIFMRVIKLEADKKKPRPQGYTLKDVAGMLHMSYPTIYKWVQEENWVIPQRNTRLEWDQVQQLAQKYNKVIDESYM